MYTYIVTFLYFLKPYAADGRAEQYTFNPKQGNQPLWIIFRGNVPIKGSTRQSSGPFLVGCLLGFKISFSVLDIYDYQGLGDDIPLPGFRQPSGILIGVGLAFGSLVV